MSIFDLRWIAVLLRFWGHQLRWEGRVTSITSGYLSFEGQIVRYKIFVKINTYIFAITQSKSRIVLPPQCLLNVIQGYFNFDSLGDKTVNGMPNNIWKNSCVCVLGRLIRISVSINLHQIKFKFIWKWSREITTKKSEKNFCIRG